MFTLKGDDVCTILHIIYLSASSGALHGKKAQHIARPPHTVSLAGTSANTSTATSEISNEGSSEFDHESHERLRRRLKMLENDLVEVTQGFSRVSDVTKDVSVLFKSLENQANMLQSSVCKDIQLAPGGNNTIIPADQLNAIVQGMADVVLTLKSQILSTGTLRVESVSDLINHLVKMPTYQKYQGCSALQDFDKNYKSLDQRLRQCLFCFSAFPEGSVVDKTLLMYWWVGEGLIDPEVNADKIVEEIANEIVEQFLDFQFVEPVTKNGKLVGLRMPPIIRYAVAYLAERANFFDFDFEWNPTSDFRLCHRACLVETADGSSQKQLIEAARLHPEKLRTLFNVNKRIVDISGSWFQNIRKVNVLFLGEWDEPLKRVELRGENPLKPVELRGENSLKWLKRMKHLRFLGLAGCDTDFEFAGAIGKLENLRILTFSNWWNESMRLSLKSFRRLTHLEINDPPKRGFNPQVIGQLTELQVLKGLPVPSFNDLAALIALVRLKKLRKLSIIRTTKWHDPTEHFTSLSHITSLRKLTIRWIHNSPIGDLGSTRFREFPGLQKLDLRNYPDHVAPYLLQSFKSLQKLYIRGGKLRDLPKEDQCNVKILRLIDLPEFHMEWERVRHQFPDLIYLETNECPKLTSFPCDANGVWLNKEKLTEKKSLEELGFSWSFLASYPSH